MTRGSHVHSNRIPTFIATADNSPANPHTSQLEVRAEEDLKARRSLKKDQTNAMSVHNHMIITLALDYLPQAFVAGANRP